MNNLHIGWPIFLTIVLGLSAPVRAQTASGLGDEFVSDFKYVVNNGADDAIDVATAPLHVGEAVPLLTSPRFYLVLGGPARYGAAHTR